jgi:MFS family permease
MTGILIAGPGLGNMLIPLLFSLVVRAYGWRTSYLLLGVTTFIFVSIGALFLRRDPRELGLRPYGAELEKSTGNGLQSEGLTMQEALRTKQYWLLCCIYFCDFFLMNVVMVHLVIHAQDQGIPLTVAASVLSVASGVCMFSRVIVGGLGDRIGYKPTFMLCLLLSLSGFVLLLFSHGLWTLYLFAAIFGFSLWSAGGLIGPITADLFGLRAHGAIYGSIFLSGTVGGAFGAVVLGYLYDIMGNYDLGFMLCIFINALSITLLSFLKSRPKGDHGTDVHGV